MGLYLNVFNGDNPEEYIAGFEIAAPPLGVGSVFVIEPQLVEAAFRPKWGGFGLRVTDQSYMYRRLNQTIVRVNAVRVNP